MAQASPSPSHHHSPSIGNTWKSPSHSPSQSLSPLIAAAELSAQPLTDVEDTPSGGDPQRSSGNPDAGVQRPPSQAGSGPAHATGSATGSTGFLRRTPGNVAPSLEVFSTEELKAELLTRLNAQTALDSQDSELRDVLQRGSHDISQSPTVVVQNAVLMLRSIAASLELSVTATCRGDQGIGSKRSRDDPDDQDPREGEKKKKKVEGTSHQRKYLATPSTNPPRHQSSPPPQPTEDLPPNIEVSVDPTPTTIHKSQTASALHTDEAGPSSRVPRERTSGQLLDDYLYDVRGKKPKQMDEETARWYEEMISPTAIVHSTLTEGQKQRRQVLQEQFQAVNAVSMEQRIDLERSLNDNLPYFEFRILGMFATKDSPRSDRRSLGILRHEMNVYEDIKTLMTTKKQDRSAMVYFENNHVQKLKKISIAKFRNIEYPVFEVERHSGVKSTFSEADFPQVNPEDLINLHAILISGAPQSKRKMVAMRSLYRFFRGELYKAANSDLHFCLHTIMSSLAFTAPNTEIPLNCKYEFGRLYSVGADIGLCYQDHNEKPVMIRKSELAKISNGTLKMINEMLVSQLKLSLPHDRDSIMTGLYRDMVLNMLDAVVQKMEHRKHLAIYYAIIGEVDKDLVDP